MVEPLVVAVAEPRRLESRGDQCPLGSLRIVGEDVQVPVRAARGIGIVACDLRTFHHEQLTIVCVANARQDMGSCKNEPAGRHFFPRKLFGHGATEVAPPLRRKQMESVRAQIGKARSSVYDAIHSRPDVGSHPLHAGGNDPRIAGLP